MFRSGANIRMRKNEGDPLFITTAGFEKIRSVDVIPEIDNLLKIAKIYRYLFERL